MANGRLAQININHSHKNAHEAQNKTFFATFATFCGSEINPNPEIAWRHASGMT
jgi:hypothetical protein